MPSRRAKLILPCYCLKFCWLAMFILKYCEKIGGVQLKDSAMVVRFPVSFTPQKKRVRNLASMCGDVSPVQGQRVNF